MAAYKFLLVFKCRNCGGRITAWTNRNPHMSIQDHLVRMSGTALFTSHRCPGKDDEYGVADLIGAREE